MSMMELTTTQIAARLGVSERTIQRWVNAGKLPAQAIAKHRYLIEEHDLERAREVQPGDTLQEQVSELATRVEALERAVEAFTLSSEPPITQAQRRTSLASSGVSSLPEGYVGLSDFYHGVPETTANRLIMFLAIRGNWIAEGHAVRRALDRAAQALAYAALRSHPAFVMCEECPHDAR